MSECVIESSSSTAKRRLLEKGVKPGPKLICHTCDNRLCSNEDHVYIGTKSSNALDKVWDQGGNKLTAWQVKAIRYLRKQGYTLEVIADCFGVTPSMISAISTRRSWAWLF